MRKTRKVYRNAKSAARLSQSNTKNMKTSSTRLLQRMKSPITKSRRANRRSFFGGLGEDDDVIELGEEDRIYDNDSNDVDYAQNQVNMIFNILQNVIENEKTLSNRWNFKKIA